MRGGGGGGGGGGGEEHVSAHLQLKRLRHSYNLSALAGNKLRIEETSKEKHSLTRKLVGYRNRRQTWCKKEGNKVLGKTNQTKILYLAYVNVTEPKEVLNIGFLYHFSFPKTLSLSLHHFNSYILPTFLFENVFLYLYSNSIPPDNYTLST